MAASFTLFPRLAAELRNQIWRDALPHHVGPALYYYRGRGCWCPREPAESEPGFTVGIDDLSLAFEFRTDLLGDDNQYHVPLFFVNREARSIAIAWLQEHNIKLRHKDNREGLFARPFSAERDALYVPVAMWDDFCLEPSERMLESDLAERSVDLGSNLTRIAVPEDLFWQSDLISCLPEMEMWFEHLKVLFIVMGSQPDRVQGPGRWELQGTDSKFLSWDGESNELTFEDQEGNGPLFQEDVYKRIKDAAEQGLREELINSRFKTLEIRPVFTVRR